ncbi:putative lipid II flippase FtsW [Kocuria sp. JC486]|uniref:putative lipid II flippase FtsW n=1 Tax=Kocuria sp. JC486 TaxID=1970736 RepID=UPI0032AF4B11
MSPRGRARTRAVSAVRHPDHATERAPWQEHSPVGEGLLRRLRDWIQDGPLVHSYYALAISAILLFSVGGMMVLSASAVESISADRSAFFYFLRQIMFGVAGVVLMFALSLVPSRTYERFAPLAFAISSALVFLVIPLGVEVNGNKNWLNIGGFTLQPSEAAKLGVALMLGWHFARSAHRFREYKDYLWPSLGIVGIPVGFVALGGDIGTVVIFGLIYLAALILIGTPWKLFGMLFGAVAVLGALAVIIAPHRMERMTGWFTGECDVSGACWQAQQGLAALATGGWWGVGLGQSRSKYNYVPEAHNDYIFAIIGEELGLIGTVLILVLFVVMGVAMARVLLRTTSTFERVVTGSVLTWLIGQAFVNIGMVTGALPVIGVPLPFISYGGSSLLMCLAAVGVVMSFTRYTRAGSRTSGPPRDEVEDHHEGEALLPEHEMPGNVRRLPSRAERNP